jgi:hypothetical protein
LRIKRACGYYNAKFFFEPPSFAPQPFTLQDAVPAHFVPKGERPTWMICAWVQCDVDVSNIFQWVIFSKNLLSSRIDAKRYAFFDRDLVLRIYDVLVDGVEAKAQYG